MRTAVRKLGNSSGVIIPKSLLRDLGVTEGDPIEMIAEAGRIVLVPIKQAPRADWGEASERIAEAGDDQLVWPEFSNVEDEDLIW
jgi:antitoxin MazE